MKRIAVLVYIFAALVIQSGANQRQRSVFDIPLQQVRLDTQSLPVAPSPPPPISASGAEYLWYETENMRGFAVNARHEPVINASWLNPSKAKAPGWGINGPGVSAEWTQGGESEWNSAAASADETNATIYQDLEVPRSGEFKVWIRYADWAKKTESFVIRITQQNREVFRHTFGTRDIIDPHDEISLYWGWAFTWDGAAAKLDKGRARLSITIESPAEARRHVDAVLVTNDLHYIPTGRQKPDFAAMRYLRESSVARSKLASFLPARQLNEAPKAWERPLLNGRDFLMPWNISKDFWSLYDKPEAERPLYPFSAELIDEFVKTYKGTRDVPIFSSKLIVPVIYLNDLPTLFKEDSAFLRYIRQTKTPFAILINYSSVTMSEAEGQAAWKLLNGELRGQFLGWISGESVGYVWHASATDLKINPEMSRTQLLEAHRDFYTNALDKKWSSIFHTPTGPMWDKLIPAQSTSSTSFAHALMNWGTRLLGVETSAVQPMTGMRLAFTRGAARQFGGAFLYYHAPNFGDSATTFTKAQNFAGPDNFFHSRYGVTMGPSLSWYRKSYYLYYMGGASAIYLEQGYDQFFKPGPGENPFQLNPLGRITEEFMRFAEKHPNRGVPYTPIGILLDPAHGWEMTDYPHWPFGISQINRSDRAIRELFGVAYYPGTVVEGEPATADRQAFVSATFGDIFDVIVAERVESRTSNVEGLNRKVQSPKSNVQSPRGQKSTSETGPQKGVVENTNRAPNKDFRPATSDVRPSDGRPSTFDLGLSSYRAIVVGGDFAWTAEWVRNLTAYLRQGGVVVINSMQTKGLSNDLLGVKLGDSTVEADSATCLLPDDQSRDLSGQLFRYQKVMPTTAQTLIRSSLGDPLVTENKVGAGKLVLIALPDLLGVDERMTPFAAHLLHHVFANATPVRVEGDVEYLVNRTADSWVVTLINNNGVLKPQQGMAQVDRNATVTATISVDGIRGSNQVRSATDWVTEKSIPVNSASGQVTISIPPGGISVIELR